ncbi:MAG: glycosyltransferase family 4 protein, partial [Nanoarchaeota archaeon]|nr:glycosyltransferase family 4 protein [Nanoarchaeota archaeon]
RHVDPSMKGDVQKIDRQITRIEKKAIPFIDFFVTLSKNVKDQFIEYYGVSPKKIKVIPPGIDLSRFMKKKKSLERPLFLRDKRVVLVVSRIAQDKNVLDAVKAFSLVKTKNAALVFIGPVVKDYFEKIKEFIRINKIKNVYFLGEKKDPENYYPLGDIFVLPSRVEAFGLVLVEAQTSGLPCIGFKRDGKETFTAVGEVVSNGENGFVVKTVEEMANKIDLLLNSDSLRKRFSKNALIHSKRYSYNRMVGLLVGIAEDLRGL